MQFVLIKKKILLKNIKKNIILFYITIMVMLLQKKINKLKPILYDMLLYFIYNSNK